MWRRPPLGSKSWPISRAGFQPAPFPRPPRSRLKSRRSSARGPSRICPAGFQPAPSSPPLPLSRLESRRYNARGPSRVCPAGLQPAPSSPPSPEPTGKSAVQRSWSFPGVSRRLSCRLPLPPSPEPTGAAARGPSRVCPAGLQPAPSPLLPLSRLESRRYSARRRYSDMERTAGFGSRPFDFPG